jgi:DNA-binding response OmpR family regulator
MMEVNHILIIEDDPEIAELVKINLEDLGSRVEIIGDGEEAYQQLQDHTYDMIILDLMLPGKDGLEICKKLRQEDTTTPLLMLTAKSEEFDKVLGLELGADDYLTKPFSIRELVARVKALLRRSNRRTNNQDTEPLSDRIAIGDLIIEPKKHRVKLEGKSLELTAKEFDLLVLFAGQPGRTFTRQELLDNIWGYQFSGYDHTVNTHINRLRSKIEEDPSEPKYLKTVWGVGYRFVEEEELE